MTSRICVFMSAGSRERHSSSNGSAIRNPWRSTDAGQRLTLGLAHLGDAGNRWSCCVPFPPIPRAVLAHVEVMGNEARADLRLLTHARIQLGVGVEQQVQGHYPNGPDIRLEQVADSELDRVVEPGVPGVVMGVLSALG